MTVAGIAVRVVVHPDAAVETEVGVAEVVVAAAVGAINIEAGNQAPDDTADKFLSPYASRFQSR